ncbi:MAG: hypothetical protein J7L44_03645 [Candidatus Diapherotrites archaeon]|nr:hypothetical protein [Candidatus Diapherotrites archaeon]
MKKSAIALILIGLVFGLEGIITSYIGLSFASRIGEELSFLQYGSTFFEQNQSASALEFLNTVFIGVAIYGAVKCLVGIFCIAAGATELFETKKGK